MAVAAAPRHLRTGSLSSGEDSYSDREDSGRMKSYVSQVSQIDKIMKIINSQNREHRAVFLRLG